MWIFFIAGVSVFKGQYYDIINFKVAEKLEINCSHHTYKKIIM